MLLKDSATSTYVRPNGVITIEPAPTKARFGNAKPAATRYLKATSFTAITFDHPPAPWVIANSTGLRSVGSTAPTVLTAVTASTAVTVLTAVTADAGSAPRWAAGSTLARWQHP